MSVAKRGLSLAVALLMIVATLSMTYVTTAYAATDGDVSNVTVKYNTDGTTVNVTFNVKDITTNTKDKNPVQTNNSTLSVEKGGAFAAPKDSKDMAVSSVRNETTAILADYTVSANNLIPNVAGKGGVLAIKVTTNDNKYTRIINLDIADKTGGTTPTPPPTPTTSNAKYTVTRVRGSKRENNVDLPNDERIYFDVNNLTGSSDASIRQTYFADITLRVFDDKAPTGIVETDIIASGLAKLDMGSFLYQKGVSTIAVTDTVDGYYEVAFTALRYSGNNKFLNFRTKKDGYIGDVTAEISECFTKKESDAAHNNNNNNNNNNDDDRPLAVETPYVIVSKYSYGGGNVTAGDTFPLSLTFYNTSETEVISNMMITITMPEGLMLTSSSNTFYVAQLDKWSSITKSVQVAAKADAKPQSHNISVSMKYQYVDDRANDRRSAETTETIAIPVLQVDRFQVTGVEVPMDIMMGEDTSITVNFVNKGRSDVYNLSAEIGGNILNPGQNQNLGNLLPGATGSADFYLKPSELGALSGEILITYEDTAMQEKKATIQYSTNVKSPEEMGGNMGNMMGGMGVMGGMGGEEVPPEEPKKSVVPIVVLCVVAAAIPVAVIVKKRIDRKRKEREDADL